MTRFRVFACGATEELSVISDYLAPLVSLSAEPILSRYAIAYQS